MQYLFLTFLFIFGMIFWSFASVLIWRIRNKEGGILTGRSHCPHCGHILSAIDLFPVFSYLFLRGKCRFCKSGISKVYPLLEITTGIIFALSGLYFLDTKLVFSLDAQEWMKWIFFLIIAFTGILFVFYDFLFMEIPDEIMIPVDILLFILLFLVSIGLPLPFFSHFLPFSGSSILNIPLVNALIWAGGIFFFFYVQILISWGKWMWGGDLRVAIFMGLVAGAKLAFLWLALAYLSGSIIGILVLLKTRSRNTELPFGPYLALWLYLALFFHTEIIDWYQKYLIIG